jgi:peptide methionine sulfoxide reductase MsrA
LKGKQQEEIPLGGGMTWKVVVLVEKRRAMEHWKVGYTG